MSDSERDDRDARGGAWWTGYVFLDDSRAEREVRWNGDCWQIWSGGSRDTGDWLDASPDDVERCTLALIAENDRQYNRIDELTRERDELERENAELRAGLDHAILSDSEEGWRLRLSALRCWLYGPFNGPGAPAAPYKTVDNGAELDDTE